MIGLASQLLFTWEKILSIKYIESILTEMNYYKKIIKKYFNKNFVMHAENEEKVQSSNICGICNKIFCEQSSLPCNRRIEDLLIGVVILILDGIKKIL